MSFCLIVYTAHCNYANDDDDVCVCVWARSRARLSFVVGCGACSFSTFNFLSFFFAQHLSVICMAHFIVDRFTHSENGRNRTNMEHKVKNANEKNANKTNKREETMRFSVCVCVSFGWFRNKMMMMLLLLLWRQTIEIIYLLCLSFCFVISSCLRRFITFYVLATHFLISTICVCI